MNRTMYFILIILIAITITSCTNDTSSKSKTDTVVAKEIKNTANVKSQVETEIKPVWQIEQVTDEFGDKVEGETAIVANFNGEMHNSAVSGADLTVRMSLYQSKFLTNFFEYGKSPSASLPESEYIIIKLKLSNGDKLEVKQFLSSNFMFDSENKLVDIVLSQNMPIKVIVDLSKANEYSSGIYYFEIDPTGLKDALKQIEIKTDGSPKKK